MKKSRFSFSNGKPFDKVIGKIQRPVSCNFGNGQRDNLFRENLANANESMKVDNNELQLKIQTRHGINRWEVDSSRNSD